MPARVLGGGGGRVSDLPSQFAAYSLDAAVCSALLYCDLIFEFLQPCGELVHFRFLQLDILAHFLVFDG